MRWCFGPPPVPCLGLPLVVRCPLLSLFLPSRSSLSLSHPPLGGPVWCIARGSPVGDGEGPGPGFSGSGFDLRWRGGCCRASALPAFQPFFLLFLSFSLPSRSSLSLCPPFLGWGIWCVKYKEVLNGKRGFRV